MCVCVYIYIYISFEMILMSFLFEMTSCNYGQCTWKCTLTHLMQISLKYFVLDLLCSLSHMNHMMNVTDKYRYLKCLYFNVSYIVLNGSHL